VQQFSKISCAYDACFARQGLIVLTIYALKAAVNVCTCTIALARKFVSIGMLLVCKNPLIVEFDSYM